MRFYWLILSSLSFLLFSSPAWAGSLLFWRFDANQNRLVFTTDDPVQPKAQLITDPTRIVIDLPGIQLDRSVVNQSIGREIKSVRVGQFDDNTTRIVIEFAPGYTVDPMQVKVKGTTARQWTVTLPTPQQVNPTYPPPSRSQYYPPSRSQPYPPSYSPPSRSQPYPPSSYSPPSKSQSSPSLAFNNSDFQITRNGLLVNLKRNGPRDGIIVQRSDDHSTINVQLRGALLPHSLNNQNFSFSQGGVSKVNFTQVTEGVKIRLSVDPDSPDWLVAYSPLGGVLLFPKEGISGTSGAVTPQPTGGVIPATVGSGSAAIIYGVELTAYNSLLIRSDQPCRGEMSWNRSTGNYEIKIPNAQLADSPTGPVLRENSPIYELRLRQETNGSVTVAIKPAIGVRVGSLTQPRPQLLSLELRTTRGYQTSSLPPLRNNDFSPLPSPPRPSIHPIRRDRPLIILDPGHGGKDTGAVGLRGIQEKDIILPISQLVAQLLEQQGLQVILTRNSDFFVSLQGRTDMANAANADLFVSIHANSIGPNRSDINGLEVYYFNDSGLANTIYQSIIRTVNIRQRGVRQARFYVLRNSKMPSTLVEVGYVTGDEDSVKLTNSAHQAQMANAIARGILEYLRKIRH